MTTSLLSIEDLRIGFAGSDRLAVKGIDLAIAPGERLGVVGESGSGKTLLARAILGLLPPGAQRRAGRILFDGQDLTALPPAALRRVRGRRIGMVFQEPMVSLNPALTIGRQLGEGLILHEGLSEAEVRRRSVEMLDAFRMADAVGCLDKYPHEFSGGMRQRIMIASALLLRPALLIADEPTTALDVIVQKQVLDLTLAACRDLGTALLLITHDLGVVADCCERVLVMRHGDPVTQGPVDPVLLRPRDPYTRQLLHSLPRRPTAATTPPAPSPPLLSIRDLRVAYPARRRSLFRPPPARPVLHGVDLSLARGETLALVGESGSGKTTLGRALLGLAPVAGGTVTLDGRDITTLSAPERRALARRVQMVFQDPFSSLDPRWRIARIVGEGVTGVTATERAKRVAAALSDVGLGDGFADRFPHELSGGQRQRVAIARAIIMKPDLIVADEPVSALDVTVQAQVLALLKDLQRRHGFSYLFISHHLGVVEQVADRVMVLYRGHVVEEGARDDLFDRPTHPYTRHLMAAVPEILPDGDGFRAGHRPLPAPVALPGLTPVEQGGVLTLLQGGHRVRCAAP